MGGGGGGSTEEGLRLGRLALELGTPIILELDDMDPAAWVATVSMVGAPAAQEAFLEPMDHVRALGKLAENLDAPWGYHLQRDGRAGLGERTVAVGRAGAADDRRPL